MINESSHSEPWWKAPYFWVCSIGLLCLLMPTWRHLQALWPNQNGSVLQTLDSHASTLIVLSLVSVLLVVLGLRKGERHGTNAPLLHGILAIACVLSLFSALLPNLWLSFVALLLLVYCLLMLLSKAGWERVATWLLPAATLVLLPSQPTWDLATFIKGCCLQSISLILESAQIPNMIKEDQILFENGFLTGHLLIRLFTDPYKLLGIGAFVLVLSRQKLLVGITVFALIVPFCWFVSTVYGSVGIILFVQEICNLFKPASIAVSMNIVCFLLISGLVVLGQRACIRLWSPFDHVPPDSIHSVFNKIVDFPVSTECVGEVMKSTQKSKVDLVICGGASLCFITSAAFRWLS